MGTSTNVTKAKFAYRFDDFDDRYMEKVPAVIKAMFRLDTDSEDEGNVELGQGWIQEESKEYGGKNPIYADVYVNSKFKIAVVNESQYSNGGAFEPTIFSSNIKNIEKFLTDFDMVDEIKNIQSNVILKQTC